MTDPKTTSAHERPPLLSPIDESDSDRVRERLAECATACLDHVRAVAWGSATSNYETNDGGLRIHVTIEVKCFEKAKDDGK